MDAQWVGLWIFVGSVVSFFLGLFLGCLVRQTDVTAWRNMAEAHRDRSRNLTSQMGDLRRAAERLLEDFPED